MSSNLSLSQLKQAYLQSANIVALYGKNYLPIFERVEKEYQLKIEKNKLLTRAIDISKSNNIN